MRVLDTVQVADVEAAYAGPECDLWELLMGAQIHVGGFQSSMQLAKTAGIQAGARGVDLCCCRGAGMRFLLRFFQVAAMTGVDLTERVIQDGRARSAQAGLSEKMSFVLADACRTGLPTSGFDFAWGEDAWCYVKDKAQLIGEATRLVRPGGVLAFTDWVEGGQPLTDPEARRFMSFMKFPSLASIDDYRQLMQRNGWHVHSAMDTGRFAECVDLYIALLRTQVTFDALELLQGSSEMLETVLGEMLSISRLAHCGKLCQALFVAVKA